MLCGQCLVEVHTQTRGVPRVHNPLRKRVRVWEDALGLGRVMHVLLDSEVVDAQIEVQRRRQTHRTQVSGAMACRADVVKLAQMGDLAQVRYTSRVNDRVPDVIDQLLLDEQLAVENRVEYLADGDGCGGVLADQAEALLELGRRGVFDPEQVVRLQAPAEAPGLNRR